MEHVATINFGKLKSMLGNAVLFTDKTHKDLDFIIVESSQDRITAKATNRSNVALINFELIDYRHSFGFQITPVQVKQLLAIAKVQGLGDHDRVYINASIDGEVEFVSHGGGLLVKFSSGTKDTNVLMNAISTFVIEDREVIDHSAIIFSKEIFKTMSKVVYPDATKKVPVVITTRGDDDTAKIPVILLEFGDWMKLAIAGLSVKEHLPG